VVKHLFVIEWQYHLDDDEFRYRYRDFFTCLVFLSLVMHDFFDDDRSWNSLLEDVGKGDLAEHVVAHCGCVVRAKVFLPQLLVVLLVHGHVTTL